MKKDSERRSWKACRCRVAAVAWAGLAWPIALAAQDAAPVETAASTAAAKDSSPIPTASLMKIMRDGGALMWPIAACSLVTGAVAFERLIALRRRRIIPGPFVKRFLQQLRDGQLDRAEALDVCEENGSPVAEVFSAAARRWGRPAVEVEQAILDAGERAANNLRKHIRVLNAVATLTPLLGLLGTVFGMIQAFNAIATTQALGRPEALATGISQALLTTAAGLVVAIPALACYLYFLGRVDGLIVEIDALGQEVVASISSEGIAELARAKSNKPKRQEMAA